MPWLVLDGECQWEAGEVVRHHHSHVFTIPLEGKEKENMVLSLFADGWAPLREFFVSDSGYAQPREGLGLGWVAGALAVLAALFHTQSAEASWCYGIPMGGCSWVCANPCGGGNTWLQYYCHSLAGSCDLMHTEQCGC